MSAYARIALSLALGLAGAGALAYYGSNPDLEAARGLFALGQSIGAEENLRRALKENPADIEAWVMLGTFLESSGRLDESLAAFEKAAALSPGAPERVVSVARVKLRMDRVDEADSDVVRLLQRLPYHVEALRLRGWAALKRATSDARDLDGFRPEPRHLEEARKHFHTALRIAPQDPDARLGRGIVAQWAGQPDEALDHLDRGLAVDSNSYWLWQIKGDVLAEQGRDEDAIEAYERAQRASQGRPYAQQSLAEVARRQKRFGDAASFDTGLDGAYTQGVDLMAAGNLSDAETSFLRALAFDPEDELALDRLEEVRIRNYPAEDERRIELSERRILLAQKARDVQNQLLAYQHYTRAIRLAPQLSKARLEAARFYEEIGSYAAAVNELARVEELTQSQEERLAASDLLEVITRKALSEMEAIHQAEFADLWEQPTSVLAKLIGDPETLEARIRWSVNPVPRPYVRIAIFPFQEVLPPAHIGIGRQVAKSLAGTLGLMPGIELVPEAELARISARHAEKGSLEMAAGQWASEVKADVIITGRILEDREAVALEIKIVKTPSGPVVGHYRISTRGPNALNRNLLELSRKVSNTVPLNGAILRRGKSSVTVNLGRIHGIRMGDTVTILRPSREILIRGFDWPSQKEDVIAIGRVVGMTERYCEVLPVEGRDRIRAGDRAKRLREVSAGS